MKLFIVVTALLLAACQTPQEGSSESVEDTANTALEIRVLSDAEVYSGTNSADTRQMIPDILYEGLQALNADRLLTPVDDNAHARFQRVLALDPQNKIALEGLQDIVKRYLELAEEAMRRGQFDESKIMLDRARFVDAAHPDIARVEDALQREMNSDDLFFELDYPEYAERSESAQQQLAEIARQAREHEAFFLITSPNDELGRWMVLTMRDAVEGYRLRGNIELSGRLGIRLMMPEE